MDIVRPSWAFARAAVAVVAVADVEAPTHFARDRHIDCTANSHKRLWLFAKIDASCPRLRFGVWSQLQRRERARSSVEAGTNPGSAPAIDSAVAAVAVGSHSSCGIHHRKDEQSGAVATAGGW